LKKFLGSCAKTALNLTITIASIALVVIVWYQFPSVLVSMFDTNVAIVKTGTAILGEDYGPMTESALRALSVEKAMIFIEVSLVLKVVVWLLKKPFKKSA
jgi:hypothetical protein